MLGKHIVYEDNREVGTAMVTQEGLYYRITLNCLLTGKEIKRSFLHVGRKIIPLGVCIPRGNRFFTDKKVAASSVPAGSVRFCIGQSGETTVNCELPWNEIYRIQDAYITKGNAGKQISFRSQAQAQQDNDPSQEHPHK